MVEQQEIKQVNEITYLGAKINSDGRFDHELNSRLQMFAANIKLLYPLFKNISFSRKVKTLIYKTVLRPILLYGSEVWTLTTKSRSKVQAAKMRILRLILGVTLEELSIESILSLISKNQLKWYGHVQRMQKNRVPLKALRWRPNTKQPV